MTYETFKLHALRLPHAWPDFPFDSQTLAIKIGSKLFALTDSVNFEFINLKCTPENSIALQTSYEGIKPAYHMNKKHWIGVYLNSDVPDALLFSLLRSSYNIVLQSLPKKERAAIENS